MSGATYDEPAKLLMVCTGNIARSPLAAVLMRDEVAQRNLQDWVEVDSAGIYARRGNPAVAGSRRAAQRFGVSLEEHGAKPTSDVLVGEADLVLTMTERQRAFVTGETVGQFPRVFTLREFVRLTGERVSVPDGGPRPYIRGVAAAAHARRARSAPEQRPEDVADPFGGPDRAFTEMARTVSDLVGHVAAVLLGERVGDRGDGGPFGGQDGLFSGRPRPGAPEPPTGDDREGPDDRDEGGTNLFG